MPDRAERLNDKQFKVIRDVPARSEEVSHDIEFLVNQKAQIEADIARNQAELAKVVNLIELARGVNVEKR